MWQRAMPIVAMATVTLAVSTPSTAADEETWDGLVRVDADDVQVAFLRPGADFRMYSKVLIDPPIVEFHKDWPRNINRSASTLSGRLNSRDVEQIREAFADGFEEILAAGFAKAGWDVGVADGPEVLRLTPALANVYMNAPDKMRPGMNTTYVVEAGEATLVLEIRDSDTDQLLGRAVDRRRTRGYGGTLMVANRVTNRVEFERLLKGWTEILVDGLEGLKEISPLESDADDQ